MDFLTGPGAIVDLSDICGDYDIYTSEMIEARIEVREGDIRSALVGSCIYC
jgi:hypothetical protein